MSSRRKLITVLAMLLNTIAVAQTTLLDSIIVQHDGLLDSLITSLEVTIDLKNRYIAVLAGEAQALRTYLYIALVVNAAIAFFSVGLYLWDSGIFRAIKFKIHK